MSRIKFKAWHWQSIRKGRSGGIRIYSRSLEIFMKTAPYGTGNKGLVSSLKMIINFIFYDTIFSYLPVD